MSKLDIEETYQAIVEGLSNTLINLGMEGYHITDAIEEGVSQALPDMGNGRLHKAIADGVENAMWRMMTNATDAPCQDFYEAVTNGIAKGIGEAASKGYFGK